jgi:hypothetical protein
MAGPDRAVKVGPYRFAFYTSGPQRWRWECSGHGLGVGGHRTPLGAWLALVRFRREQAARRG